MSEGKVAYSDPLLSSLIDIGALGPSEIYYLGFSGAMAAGTCLAMGHSLAKSTLMTEEHPSASKAQKSMASVACSLLMAVALIAMF